MTLQLTDRAAWLRFISVAILIGGLCSAVVIFAVASPPAANPLGDPEDSRQYLRQMEMYGGKENLLGAEIREWLVGLWHGRSLALTVAVLSAVVAAGCRFAAIPLPTLEEMQTRQSDGSAGRALSVSGGRPVPQDRSADQ
jgi:hypothetical protein